MNMFFSVEFYFKIETASTEKNPGPQQGFYSTFIKNSHVDSKPFYEFLRDEVLFKWTRKHEKLFQNIKDRISEETNLAVPNPKYPFFVHVDSSSSCTESILVQ